MKKIFFIFLLLFATFNLTTSANMNFSFSGNGAGMDANIHREGDLIYMSYSMSGLNSPDIVNRAPAEQQEAISAIRGANVDLILSCSNKAIKIRSFRMTDTNGYTYKNTLDANWIPLVKEDDLQKVNELCNKL